MEVATPKIKKGYKQTEVGVIPEDWNLSILGEECDLITKGTTPTSIGRFFQKSGINFIKIESLDKKGNIIQDKVAYIDSETHELLKRSQLKNGDILFSIAGALGRVGVVTEDVLPANTNQALAIIRLNKENVLRPGYVLHSLNTVRIKKHIESISVQGAQANLSLQNVNDLPIVFPNSVKEQDCIASSLSDTDSLIQSLDALIEKRKNIKTATMQQLLTGKTRLPGFSGEWEKVKLGLLLDYIQPQEYLVSSTDYSDAFKTPVLTAGKTFILGYTNEESGKFTDLPCIIFDDFTTDSKFVDFPFKAKSSAMKMLVPKSETVNLKFVFEAIQQIDFKIGDHKRYWISEYQGIEILLPGPKEQDAIVSVLCDMNAEITDLEKRRDKLIAIKQGMMYELLTGNTRLV